MTPKSSILPS